MNLLIQNAEPAYPNFPDIAEDPEVGQKRLVHFLSEALISASEQGEDEIARRLFRTLRNVLDRESGRVSSH